MSRPPLPPFNDQTAVEKVRLAEDGWNSRDPAKVALAYTPDTKWRNRVEFASNREQAQAFLERKWNRELEYRLIKQLWAYAGNRIAVRFAYEYHDDSGQWHRAYGNENWEFAEDGLMRVRHAACAGKGKRARGLFMTLRRACCRPSQRRSCAKRCCSLRACALGQAFAGLHRLHCAPSLGLLIRPWRGVFICVRFAAGCCVSVQRLFR